MKIIYIVKRGKHYSQCHTCYAADSEEKCKEWIKKHMLPGEHMYIATAHEVVIDEQPELEQIGGFVQELI